MVLSKQTLIKFFFHPKKGNNPVNIEINNTIIESIGEHREKVKDRYMKFLGFKIDDELTNIISKKSNLMIYHSLIASHLLYVLSIWGNSGPKKLNKFEKKQKKQ